jgi:hypothetical protein
MKLHQFAVSSLALGALALAPAARAALIPTNFGAGADAEVREEAPTTNRGSNSEIASRIIDNFPAGHANDGNDRNSLFYLKFDITGQGPLGDQTTAIQLTYRNNNLSPNRVHDTETPNLEFRTGIAFYGLHPDHAGNNWDESTITYLTAPGLNFDGNVGTKDYDTVDPDGGGGPMVAPLIPLGVKLYPVVPPQNRLPIGGIFRFASDDLDDFIGDALEAGKSTVTIVAGIVHDGKIPITSWKNFNYLFNPKEQTTLNTDAAYDADVNNPDNPLGSPWSGADNSAGAFSPTLAIVPEPSAMGLLVLSSGALGLGRRRR